MVNVSIARRYARALISIATESGQLDPIGEQLSAFADALRESPDLARVLENPAYSKSQRKRVVEALLPLAKASPATANLLRLLVDRDRVVYLPDIVRLYRDEADKRSGRVRGKVTTAVALGQDALSKLEQALERLTQRDVVLEAKVDPKVLGGASTQVGSVLYDGTVRSHLEELRRRLRG